MQRDLALLSDLRHQWIDNRKKLLIAPQVSYTHPLSMRSRPKWKSACCLLALTWMGGGCGTTREKPDEPVVRSLRIEGAKQISEGAIKDKILTSETSWWPFAGESYFDLNAWHADLRRIERFYQSEGYYQAKVVEEEITPKPPDGVDLKVKVQEGEPTRISKIEIAGADSLPSDHRQVALADLPIREKAILREEDWEDAKKQIQSRLRELGYAEAVAAGNVYVQPQPGKADVELRIAPGERYRFGNVFVATIAKPRVPTGWILDQTQSAIGKNRWFSESALAEAENRVFKMGVFAAVKVAAGAPDRAQGTVPVIVDVREAPFHTLRVGGGVGVDQVRNEARLISEYTDRDFFGGLRKLTLRGKVGWAFIPSIISVIANVTSDAPISGPIYKASAELEQPRVIIPDMRLQTSVSSERGLEQAFSYYSNKAKIGVIWQPHSSFYIFPSYNIEVDYLAGASASLSGRSPELFFGCPDEPCVLSYLEQAIVWDRRDDRQEPRSGYYLGISFQEGGGPLGGSFSYFRIEPEARYFISFPRRSKRFTIAAKVKLGTLIPTQGESGLSPIIARFFSGGGNDMRGFNSRRLSPLYALATDDSTFQNGIIAPIGRRTGITVPVGGNGLVEASLELRYNVVGDLVLAVFLDTGFVTTSDILSGLKDDPSYFSHNMQYAVGFGLRYRTILGPIRLDLGYRLNIGPPLPVFNPPPPVSLPTPQIGCFGLIGHGGGPTGAGSPEGVCTLHLSIGEAF